jgi:hypothetical protein
MAPFPLQIPEEKEKKNWGLKYMHYNVHCTYIGMYITVLKKILSKMFPKIFQTLPG